MTVRQAYMKSRSGKRQEKEFIKLLSKRERMSLNTIFRNNVKDAIAAYPDTFNEDFLKDLIARHTELERSCWVVWLFLIATGAFLASRFFGGADISILGVSLKSPTGVREPLIVLISAIGVVNLIQRHQVDRLRIVLAVFTDIKSGEADRSIFALRYAATVPIEIHYPRIPRNKFQGWALTAIGIIFIAIIATILVLCAIAIFVIGALNVYDIILRPSYDHIISYFVAAIWFLSSILSIVFLIFNSYPFSYRDYTVSNELAELAKKDKEKHDAQIRELSHQAFLNAGLCSPFRDLVEADKKTPSLAKDDQEEAPLRSALQDKGGGSDIGMQAGMSSTTQPDARAHNADPTQSPSS